MPHSSAIDPKNTDALRAISTTTNKANSVSRRTGIVTEQGEQVRKRPIYLAHLLNTESL
jgi:hypothetical protein